MQKAQELTPNLALRSKIISLLERWADWSEQISVRVSLDETIMPGGQNGPYFDLETPIRNSAHWLSFYSILQKYSSTSQNLERAQRLKAFFDHSAERFSQRYGFVHRQKPGKDQCNGVIGPAWVAESFNFVGRSLKDTKYLEKANKIISSFQYSKADGCWRRLHPEEGVGRPDLTYNHQAWLASIKFEVEGPGREIENFLDTSLNRSLRVHADGRISHLLYSASLQGRISSLRFQFAQARKPEHFEEKEIGYQLFVLFALARLKAGYEQHPLFSSAKLERALAYIDKQAFLDALEKNSYAYPYNSPAYELPLVFLCWRDKFNYINEDAVIECIEKMEKDFSPWSSSAAHAQLPDPLTLFSRIYELAICLENFEWPRESFT